MGPRSALALLCALLGLTAPAAASEPGRLVLRASAAMATLTTRDQIGYLRYDEPGVVGTLHFGYALLPWLDARLGAAGGAFLSSAESTGGLLAPNTGLVAHLTDASVLPYVSLDVGAGITGALVRPFAQLGVGADFPLGGGYALGPYLGLGRVLQTDALGSSDAGYLFIGLSLSFRSQRSTPITERRVIVERVRVPAHDDSLGLGAAPEPVEPSTRGPSAALLELIEQAVPSARTELLAPVLFAFDSDRIEPIGIAMLHEVTRLLRTREDLEAIEILGYADRRGDAEYNRDLSERRAHRVMEFLIEQGIAPERLRIAAHGATDFVEPGDTEPNHTQNRRVVFRVVREAEP